MERKAKEPRVVLGDEGLKTAVDAVLRTEAGIKLWAYLARRCGFFTSSLSRRTDGEIAELGTEAREAQRLIYLELRALAATELRAAAEKVAEQPAQIKTTTEEGNG